MGIFVQLVMGLKYIYAGYSKCGTKTIAEVFRILGFVVHDFEETVVDDLDYWLKFYNENTTTEERKQILYEMYKNVDVVTDAPAFYFWKELMEVFPEAKCIFHEREEKVWFKSFQNQMDKICARKKLPDPLQNGLTFLISPTLHKYNCLFVYNLSGHFVSKAQNFINWDLS